MKKLLLILLCLPMIGFGQWSQHSDFSNLEDGIFNTGIGHSEFLIDQSNNFYVIIRGDHSLVKYDNLTQSWSIIADTAHQIALDNNNTLFKVTQKKPPFPPYNQCKFQIEVFNANVWNIVSSIDISIDSLIDLWYPNGTPFGSDILSWGFDRIDDFKIINSEMYISLSGRTGFSLSLNGTPIGLTTFNESFVLKFNMTSNEWLFLPQTGFRQEWWYNWDKVPGENELNFDVNGNLYLAGSITDISQGVFNPTGIAIKMYNSILNDWQLKSNITPLFYKYNRTFLHTNNNNEFILAHVEGSPNATYPSNDSLMIYKLDQVNNTLVPYNNIPDIDFWGTRAFSFNSLSNGNPVFVFESEAWQYNSFQMTMVYYFDNITNTWKTIDSPIFGVNSLGMVGNTGTYPIIKKNNNGVMYLNNGGDTNKKMYAHQNIVNIDDVSFLEKRIIKKIDILGRETKDTKNQPLFYIYDDGTVEKRIVIE